MNSFSFVIFASPRIREVDFASLKKDCPNCLCVRIGVEVEPKMAASFIEDDEVLSFDLERGVATGLVCFNVKSAGRTTVRLLDLMYIPKSRIYLVEPSRTLIYKPAPTNKGASK